MSNALLAKIEADDRARELTVFASELRDRLFILAGRDDPHSRLLRAMIVQDRIWLLSRAKAYKSYVRSIDRGEVPDMPEPVKVPQDWTERIRQTCEQPASSSSIA